MQLLKVASAVALLSGPSAFAVSGKLTTDDALAAVFEVKAALSTPVEFEKRACRYGDCGTCLGPKGPAPCKAFERDGDCLSCALQW